MTASATRRVVNILDRAVGQFAFGRMVAQRGQQRSATDFTGCGQLFDVEQADLVDAQQVVEGQRLELALESPAMNLVGFEHAAVSSSDKVAVAHAQHHLQTPLTLFGIAPQGCRWCRA